MSIRGRQGSRQGSNDVSAVAIQRYRKFIFPQETMGAYRKFTHMAVCVCVCVCLCGSTRAEAHTGPEKTARVTYDGTYIRILGTSTSERASGRLREITRCAE
ncbi:hypothetical protein LY76DRAFT_272559 [Colletotrichum caudatum]|nr:hypothetical protein LY76DRAFT_272559 [Colletotrichum caudatum]